MKKLLITTVALAGLTVHCFGQGEVLFANTAAAATKVYISTNMTWGSSQAAGIAGGLLTPGNSVTPLMYALFVAPNSVTTVQTSTAFNNVGTPWADVAWTFSGQYATNTGSAGRLAAVGPFSATGSGGVTMPNGFGVGSTASLMVVGWDVAHGGSSLSSFINAWDSKALGLTWGASAIGSIILGNGSTPPDSVLFGTTAGQLGGFTMSTIVPEPTSFALAGLGAAAMLIFRRRK